MTQCYDTGAVDGSIRVWGGLVGGFGPVGGLAFWVVRNGWVGRTSGRVSSSIWGFGLGWAFLQLVFVNAVNC